MPYQIVNRANRKIVWELGPLGKSSSALTIYDAWVNDGTWNDNIPTYTPTWSSPDGGGGGAFAVWDDSVVTA
jgi:hypothetical protein